MNRKHAGIGAGISAGAIGIVLLVPLTFGSMVPQDAASDVPTVTLDEPYNPTTDTIPEGAKCAPVDESKVWTAYTTPEVGAGNPALRNYATAIVRPYEATTKEASRAETFTIGCADMTELSQKYQWAATLPDDIVVKGWINAFLDTVEEKGLGHFYEVGPAGTTVVTSEGRVYAEYMNAFISQFTMDGLQARDDSVHMWQLGPYDPQNIPTVKVTDNKDPKESWIYTLLNKFDQCLERWGINPAGGELVVYTCEGPVTPDTPTSTPTPTPTTETEQDCEDLYGPGWTGTPPNCKDPESGAVYNNDDVDDFYNDDASDDHTTNNNDGATDAAGNQGDQAAAEQAARDAAAKAAAEQAARDAAAKKAAEEAEAARRAEEEKGKTEVGTDW